MNEAEIFAELRAGATLVTANKRLAREIRQQFNKDQRAQLDQGKQAWDTADILPFEAWIFRLWQDIDAPSATTQDKRIVLNTLQSKAVWTNIISADIAKQHRDSESLWNVAATVQAVMEAWRISCQWHIDIAECAKSYIDDHRCFARCADLFRCQCQKNKWIDKHQLIDVVLDMVLGQAANASALADCPNLIWMGFDDLTTQQERLKEILQQNHIQLSIHVANNDADVDQQFQKYDSESAQWLAAAHWIKDKLESKPNQPQRLGVVVPNLNQSRDTIEHALSQVLSPPHLFDSGSSRAKPFHISLGAKLNDAPVVDAALLLLSLTSTTALPSATIRSLILSSFIGGADSECDARNKFEFGCRQKLPYELTFSKFLGFLDSLKQEQSDTLSIFREKITANNELLATIAKKRSFSAWSEFFLTWLDNFGWPGERVLNSEQYQTVDAFKREVCVLRSLDMLGKDMNTSATATTALAVLRQRLREQPFEQESPHVQVDVLGIIETVGIQFDAIWFGNLTERNWPPALQASPFIPRELQRQAGYHRAEESLNREYAEKQQTRLRAQCHKMGNEMVWSYYAFERDVELLPSTLFEQAVTSPEQPPSLIKQLQATKPEFEILTDTQGQGLGESESATRGGTAVIRDQAACPFRAYARHRLGARDAESRQPGLDAADRGKLIHGVLEKIWREIKTSEKLAGLSDNALEQIIDHNIRECSKQFFHQSGGKGFFKAQMQWLNKLLLEWFTLEKNQPQAFRVIECEKKQPLILGRLTLNFKIDRMDEFADKTLRLIDYKTGTTGTIVDWFGDRPKEPQLPLYALAHACAKQNNDAAPLSVLQFGQVRAGQCRYVGINEDNLLKTAKHVSDKFSGLETAGLDDALDIWQSLIAFWQGQLTELANQYYAGHAEVNPLNNATCDHCDLPGLCRIAEVRLDNHALPPSKMV